MSEEHKAQMEDNLVHQDYEVITDHSETNPGSSADKSTDTDKVEEKADTEEKKIQESLEDFKKIGNVVKGLVGGFMKEFIPKMTEARSNIKDILTSVLDQVEKENSTDDQSTASDDLDKLVKEIEEEFKSIKGRATMSINVSQEQPEENEQDENDEEQDENEQEQDENEQEQDENEQEQDENEEEYDDEQEENEEEYDDEQEEQDDAFGRCMTTVVNSSCH